MTQQRKSKQPNIVLIMADQLTPNAVGAYGNKVVKTPNIDALAQSGVTFDSAYTNCPLCAPARFSFMSGQHISKIGAYDNASEFPSSIPTFAHYLREMGYQTALSGKMHFVGADQLHGFNERVTTDIYPSDFAWTPDWENANARIDKWYHNMDVVKEAGTAATTFQIEYDDEVAFFAQRKIYDYAKNKIDPFMMVVSFIHPHDPYVALPEWWNLYDHDAIDMPKVAELPEDQQDNHTKRLLHGIKADVDRVTPEMVRNARHAYYANTSYFDSKVGMIRQTLERAGLADDTIIMVTADHGDMMGERGLWYKMNFFEDSARVPLIMSGPGLASGGRVPNNCSLVDLLPTFLDFAAEGVDKPALGQPITGRSLVPLAKGTAVDDPDEAIAEYTAECASHPIFMIRRGQFKYIACEVDPPQLYDIATDPHELTNLVNDTGHAAIAESFAKEVAARWDSQALRADVIRGQRSRRVVYNAMQDGTLTSWDYWPPRDFNNEYVRNHQDWTEAAERNRFPPFGAEFDG